MLYHVFQYKMFYFFTFFIIYQKNHTYFDIFYHYQVLIKAMCDSFISSSSK